MSTPAITESIAFLSTPSHDPVKDALEIICEAYEQAVDDQGREVLRGARMHLGGQTAGQSCCLIGQPHRGSCVTQQSDHRANCCFNWDLKTCDAGCEQDIPTHTEAVNFSSRAGGEISGAGVATAAPAIPARQSAVPEAGFKRPRSIDDFQKLARSASTILYHALQHTEYRDDEYKILSPLHHDANALLSGLYDLDWFRKGWRAAKDGRLIEERAA